MHRKLVVEWDEVLDMVMSDPHITECEADFLATIPDLHKSSAEDFEIAAEIVERWLHRCGWSQPFGIKRPTYH